MNAVAAARVDAASRVSVNTYEKLACEGHMCKTG